MPNAFNFRNPPYDRLTELEQEKVRQSVDIVFFSKGERVISPGDGVDQLLVIIKGRVSISDGDQILAELGQEDTFDSQSMIVGKGQHLCRVEEDAICYSLPKALVEKLIQDNPRFGAYFFQDIAQKLNALALSPDQSELQSLIMTRIRDAYVSRPRFLDGQDSIHDAAALMKAERATSVLVKDGDRTGILTTSDLRDIILQELPVRTTPVSWVANYDLKTIEEDDFLFNALVLMAKHSIQRVVVSHNGAITGVLEQVDLLSYVSNHSHIIGLQIERAGNIAELRSAAAHMPRLIELLARTGVKVPHIAQLVQELNGKLFAKLFRLLAPTELVANSCLVVLGSEGRGEQILKTDQDNALIVADDFSYSGLDGVAREFSQTLIEFGYPPCPGGIMVSNPNWCKPLKAFKDDLFHWVNHPSEAGIMNLAIFVDAHAIAGKSALLAELRGYLQLQLDDNGMFYSRFAHAAEHFDSPLGFFTTFRADQGDYKNEIDLKKGGIFPIVHGVRSLALEKGLTVTNTLQRIDQLRQSNLLDERLAQDLKESLTFLQQLKLKTGLDELRQGKRPDNLIRPHKLTTLERDLLKDSLVVVKRFRQLLRHHFKLQAF